jgi:hypothetical protein
VQGRDVQGDRSRIGDVKTDKRAIGGDAAMPIAALSRQMA